MQHGFRLACCWQHYCYAKWSPLAVSELQLSAVMPLWLYHQVASFIKLNRTQLSVVYRLVVPLREVTLSQLYKHHHQSDKVTSGKLVWKKHYPCHRCFPWMGNDNIYFSFNTWLQLTSTDCSSFIFCTCALDDLTLLTAAFKMRWNQTHWTRRIAKQAMLHFSGIFSGTW